jgi:hypothetical protein
MLAGICIHFKSTCVSWVALQESKALQEYYVKLCEGGEHAYNLLIVVVVSVSVSISIPMYSIEL